MVGYLLYYLPWSTAHNPPPTPSATDPTSGPPPFGGRHVRWRDCRRETKVVLAANPGIANPNCLLYHGGAVRGNWACHTLRIVELVYGET